MVRFSHTEERTCRLVLTLGCDKFISSSPSLSLSPIMTSMKMK